MRRSLKERRASPYTIRQVCGEEYADELAAMLAKTDLPGTKYEIDQWWVTFFEGHPVGYLAIVKSTVVSGAAYLYRVGVLPAHRGNCLQLRMMRVAERWASMNGFRSIISDTRDNPPSANNFIRAGYMTWKPAAPWSFAESIYWRKAL